MNRKWLILLPVVIVVLVVVLNRPTPTPEPAEPGPKRYWFKGNTHTHTLWSDGNDFPEMVAAWYKERDYDFLGLSDHNILSRGEKWMKTKQVLGRQKKQGPTALEKYLEKFGEDWVELRGEGDAQEVRLKNLEELRAELEEEGEFLLIEAEEITDKFRQAQVHVNALNLDELIPPQHGESVVETLRNNLVKVREQAERLGKPIVAHLNHPNFHFSFTAEQIAEVVEAQFFEVYNGHPGINHLGNDLHPGDEQLWDLVNAMRIGEMGAAPILGVATDDSHYYHGGNVSPGRGWIMVLAEELEADTLMRAMEAGDFYCSSGVNLTTVTFAGGTLSLEIDGEEGVTYTTQFVGTREGEAIPGEQFDVTEDLKPVYRMRGDELYVRAVVTSSKPHPNPSFADQKEQAWTQPVGWRK